MYSRSYVGLDVLSLLERKLSVRVVALRAWVAGCLAGWCLFFPGGEGTKSYQHSKVLAKVCARATDRRFPLDGARSFKEDVCGLARVNGWMPYDRHGLAHVSWVGSIRTLYIRILRSIS